MARPARLDDLTSELRSAAIEALKGVLDETPAEFWYEVIRRTHGSAHDDLILWMVRDKRCDFSVAAYALLTSDLPSALRTGSTHSSRLHIARTIIANWEAGYYREHAIDCTPDTHYTARLLREAMAMCKRSDIAGRIPKRFLSPVGGQPHDLPLHLSPDHNMDVWVLMQAAGLSVGSRPPGLLSKIRGIARRLKFSARGASPRPVAPIRIS